MKTFSHLAAHQRLPQTGVPLLEACAGSAPVSVNTCQSLLQFWIFLSAQVHRQHDGLVVSKHLLHLLQENIQEYKHATWILFIRSVVFWS